MRRFRVTAAHPQDKKVRACNRFRRDGAVYRVRSQLLLDKLAHHVRFQHARKRRGELICGLVVVIIAV